MPFRYQLQKVLDLMERREKAIDAQVLEASARLNAEQGALDEIELRKTAAQKGLGAQMASGATDVAASNDYIQVLGQRADAQKKNVRLAEKRLDEVQAVQTKARQERQKIEKHKAMKHGEWLEKDKKREAQRIDEMAGTIFMKQRNAKEAEQNEQLERLQKLQQLKALKALREKRENAW